MTKIILLLTSIYAVTFPPIRSPVRYLNPIPRFIPSEHENSNHSLAIELAHGNNQALSMLENLFFSSDGWEFVANRSNVVVEKRFLPAGPFVSIQDASKGSKHICIKASGILRAPAEKVFKLFVDNSRVHEYNDHCTQMQDIGEVVQVISDSWTKITWAAGPKYGPLKPRDFCSVVHYIQYPNGTYLILNRPAYDANCSPTRKYVRATVLLAGNRISPLANGYTHLTQITHVNPGALHFAILTAIAHIEYDCFLIFKGEEQILRRWRGLSTSFLLWGLLIFCASLKRLLLNSAYCDAALAAFPMHVNRKVQFDFSIRGGYWWYLHY